MMLTGQSSFTPLLSLVIAVLIVLGLAIVAYLIGRYQELRRWKSVVSTLQRDKRELELTCSGQCRLIEQLQERIQHLESRAQR